MIVEYWQEQYGIHTAIKHNQTSATIIRQWVRRVMGTYFMPHDQLWRVPTPVITSFK